MNIWIICSAIFFVLFCVGMFFTIKFTRRVLAMEDRIEDALEVLDNAEASITQSLQKPLFFDNPEIRKTVDDIKMVRQAIIEIGNAIQYPIEYEEEEIDEEEFKKRLLNSGNVIRLDKKYDN